MRLEEIARAKELDCDTIEIWFADEARIGQKNKITRRWAKRGTRPSAPRDQRTASTYIFGAVCPKRGTGAALILPACNTEAMNLHLTEIAAAVAPAAHAVLLVDQAGWHMSTRLVVPANITIIALPPKCPELNPVENVWQFMRDNWLSNRIFKSFDDIRRSLLLGLEHAHRSAVKNHVHRPSRLGSRRSLNLRIGIRTSDPLFLSWTRPRVFRCNTS
jgi:DDE superfamily endonuclease